MSGRPGGATVLCIPHAQDLVRGGPGCVVCALEAGNERLRSRLAEVEGERNTWQSRHSTLLDEFKDLRDGELPELRARLAEVDAALGAWGRNEAGDAATVIRIAKTVGATESTSRE